MDNLDFAFQVMVIGFLVVMFTLFILFAILIIFSRIFYKTGENPLTAEPAGGKENVNIVKNAVEPRIVAAITAAIFEYTRNSDYFIKPGGMNISIQHAGNKGNNWNILSRKILLEKSADLAEMRRKKQRENF